MPSHATAAQLRADFSAIDTSIVAVTAEITPQGGLKPVEEIWNKLCAAMEAAEKSSAIQYVVVSEDQAGLELFSRHPSTRIIKAATFAQAIEKLAEEQGPYMALCHEEAEQVDRNDPLDPATKRDDFFTNHYQLLPLRLIGRAGEPKVMEEEDSRGMRVMPKRTLEDALTEFLPKGSSAGSRPPRLAFIGPPGSGKTMLENYLAWRVAKDRIGLSVAPSGEPLFDRPLAPVRVKLRDWQKWSTTHDNFSLAEFLSHQYRGLKRKPGPEHFSRWLERGSLLILFDALDEVDSADTKFLNKALFAVLSHHSTKNCPMVLTCRTGTFLSFQHYCQNFSVYRLEKLTDDQRDAIINTYGLTREPAALIQHINSSLHLKELAADPMLLKIFLYVANNTTGELPSKRCELYHHAIDMILEHRVDGADVRVEKNLVRLSVEEIALTVLEGFVAGHGHMQVERSRLILDLQARRKVNHSAPDPELLLKQLETGGLFRRDSENRWFFSHRTFQEYLVGSALARLPHAQSVKKAFDQLANSLWRVPLLLMVGEMSRTSFSDFEQWLDEFLKETDPLAASLGYPRSVRFIQRAVPEMVRVPGNLRKNTLTLLIGAYARLVSQLDDSTAQDIADDILKIDTDEDKASLADALKRSLTVEGLTAEERRATARLIARALSERDRPSPFDLGSDAQDLAVALTKNLHLDSASEGWPIDRALSLIVTRYQVGGVRDSLRTELLSQRQLASKFASDCRWVRIGLALYGGLDQTCITQSADVDLQLQAKMAWLKATESGDQDRILIAKIERQIDDLKKRSDELSKQAWFDVKHFHRESAAVTPLILDALQGRMGEREFIDALGRLARGEEEPDRLDAVIALIAAGESVESFLPADLADSRALSDRLKRIAAYISGSIQPTAAAAIEGILKSIMKLDSTRGRDDTDRRQEDRWSDFLEGLNEIQRRFATKPAPLIAIAEHAGESAKPRIFCEVWKQLLDPAHDDPQAQAALLLLNQGRVLAKPRSRLIRALAMVPFTSSDGLEHWPVDRLMPRPSSDDQGQMLAVVLDVAASIPQQLDFVAGTWIKKLAAPLLKAGLLEEARLLVRQILPNDPISRREIFKDMDRLSQSADRSPRPGHSLNVKTWLDFRLAYRRGARTVAAVAKLAELAGAIPDPTQRFWALEKTAWMAWRHRAPFDLGGMRAAAAAIVDPENQCRALAKLAMWLPPNERQPVLADLIARLDQIDDAKSRARLKCLLGSTISPDVAPESEARQGLRVLSHLREPLDEAGGVSASPLILGALIEAARDGIRADQGPSELWHRLGTVTDPAALQNLQAILAAGELQLTLDSAIALDRMIHAGEADAASALLVSLCNPEPCCLPIVKSWVASRNRDIQKRAQILIAEADGLSEANLRVVIDVLTNEEEEDLLRHRAAILLLGKTAGVSQDLCSSSLAEGFILKLGQYGNYYARSSERLAPPVAAMLRWAFHRICHDDGNLLKELAHCVDEAGDDADAASAVLRNIESLDERAWPVMLQLLLEGKPPSCSALLTSIAVMIARRTVSDSDWRTKLYPLIYPMRGSESIRQLRFILDPINSLMTAAERASTASDLNADDRVKLARDVYFSFVKDLGDAQFDGQSAAEFKQTLSEVGALRLYTDRHSRQLTEAAEFIEESPQLLGILIEWLEWELIDPLDGKGPDNGDVLQWLTGELLAVVNEAASRESLKKLFLDNAGRCKNLVPRLRGAVQKHNSFGGRVAAIDLLGKIGVANLETAKAFEAALRDVLSVQNAVVRSASQYKHVEKSFLDTLCLHLRHKSAAYAYVAAQVLGAIAAAEHDDSTVRNTILRALSNAAELPGATRKAHVILDERGIYKIWHIDSLGEVFRTIRNKLEKS